MRFVDSFMAARAVAEAEVARLLLSGVQWCNVQILHFLREDRDPQMVILNAGTYVLTIEYRGPTTCN